MAEAIINRLKSKRSVLRTAITKYCKKIESELAKPEVSVYELEEALEQLNDKAETLKIADSEMEQYLKPDEFGKEFESAEEYREKITLWKFRAKKHINDVYQNSLISVAPSTHTSGSETQHAGPFFKETANIKLPKLSIPKFYGDSCQWLNFWNSFESAIHNNESLNKIDKFNYLKAHLGGTAASTVDGFSLSSENYDAAIKLLEKRFGRKDILINAHMSNLLNIPPLRYSNDLRGFRNMFDKCQTQIRSLEALGVVSDTYGSILCPMLLKLLPPDLVLDFNKTECIDTNYKIKDLMDFLMRELNSRERAKTVIHPKLEDSRRQHFPPPNSFVSNERNKQNKHEHPRIASSAELVCSEVKDNRCIFCDQMHENAECKSAQDLSLEDRKAILIKKGGCFRCLKTRHISRFCKVKITCQLCGNRHHAIMCQSNQSRPAAVASGENSVLTNKSGSNEVFLQTLIARIHEKDVKPLVRILIDTGSSRSYVSKFIAEKLNLKCLGEETIVHGLFGGIIKSEKHKRFLMHLAGVDGENQLEIEVLDQQQICGAIPRVHNLQWDKDLQNRNIYISDFMLKDSCLHREHPDEVHVLLGADIAGKLFTNKIEHLSCGLVAMHTKLGWTVMGKAFNEDNTSSSMLVLSLFVNDAKLSDLWNLETLGISDPIEENRKRLDHSNLLDQFKNDLKILPEGRYELCLPFKLNPQELPSNKGLAWKRHEKTCTQLKTKGLLTEYQAVFHEWENLGIVERVPEKEIPDEINCHYLPHRPVIKYESLTSKIRPVFDASAREKNKISLNECLYTGPNLIELIPDIVDRFRTYPIGLSADIEKAFLQLSVTPKHRNFLRFYYPSLDEKIIYRHRRVVFGVSSSPFLLAASITHLLENVSDEDSYIAQKLKSSFYVDNLVTGVNDIQEEESFILKAKQILNKGCFNLRQWESNRQSEYTSKSTGETNVLGILWNLNEDTLKCNLNFDSISYKELTKRLILATVQRIFDPIGILCPSTLPPKILLQETWKTKIAWDASLPDELEKMFQKWLNETPLLKEIKIPRFIEFNKDSELHTFVDASKNAYAACIFVRTVTPSGVMIQLIRAKNRVAPLKQITIPRLELMACCIGARLAQSVLVALDLPDLTITFWSDSMIALWWERLVRVVKELLRRTLGKATLTYEEMQTILCECEAIVNSRPLTYLSEDCEDFVPLTPAMFLIENSNSTTSDVDIVDAKSLRKRIKYRLKLMKELKLRFRKEYLGQLILMQRERPTTSNLQLGEIVLIGDDFKKRLYWPLAKVIELIPGKDGKVRTVRLKTQYSNLVRPIQRIFPLELRSNDLIEHSIQRENECNNIPDRPSETTQSPPAVGATDGPIVRATRAGRVLKAPDRLDL